MDAIGSNRTPETPGRSRVEIVDHGPALLRIYLMVGWAALAILSVVSGLVYRRMAVGALTYDTEGRAAAIAQQFIATSWPGFRAFARGAAGLSPEALRADPEVARIEEDVLRLLEGSPVVEVQVYAKDGLVVYATVPDEMGRYSTNSLVLDTAAGRRYGPGRRDTSSELLHYDTLNTLIGPHADVDVVVTHVAIRTAVRGVEGVVSIGQDVTPALERIARTQLVWSGGIVALGTLLLGISLVKTRGLRSSD